MTASLLLLADSQLLFREALSPALHGFIKRDFAHGQSAVYFGAANGHQPEFYDLAQQGLACLFGRPLQTQMIDDASLLPPQPSNVVVLAGGNVTAGWQWLSDQAVMSWLHRCYRTDALIIGVSAGAIHMARGIDPESGIDEVAVKQPQRFLDWLPYSVAVHEESLGWPSLKVMAQCKPHWKRLAIPMGGGLFVHQEQTHSVGNACFFESGDTAQSREKPC